MTREVASKILKIISADYETFDEHSINKSYHEACRMGAEALRAMREPRSETGIVTCGCGGIGQLIYDVDDGREIYCIRCIVCKIKSRWCSTDKEVICVWNKAMGWREDNEN